MKKIKFRAWDKEIKKMYEVIKIDFYNEKVGYLFADPTIQSEAVGYLKVSDIELMQSTGLKDKNGVEIYEGDIIRTTWPDCTAVVTWDSHRFIGYTIGYEKRIIYVDRVDKNNVSAIEVIGNIYENPEILEVF